MNIETYNTVNFFIFNCIFWYDHQHILFYVKRKILVHWYLNKLINCKELLGPLERLAINLMIALNHCCCYVFGHLKHHLLAVTNSI